MKNLVFTMAFILATLISVSVWSQGKYEQVKQISQNSTNLTASPLSTTNTKDIVDLSTGRINYNFPIFSISAPDFALPISLKYSSNGQKVSAVASQVGLGWELLAGGKITRTIKGLRDEIDYNGYLEEAGDLVSTYLFDGSIPPVPNPYDPASPSGQVWREELLVLQDVSTGVFDGEPDVYSFNFGNYSGSFVFDLDGEIHLIPQKNLSISYQTADMHNGMSNDVVSFEIIDYEKGIKFTFGNTASSREEVLNEYITPYVSLEYDWTNGSNYNGLSRYIIGGTPAVNNDGHYTSWYLTEIEFLNNDELIQIGYDLEGIWTYVGSDESTVANSCTAGFDPDYPFVVSRFNKAVHLNSPIIQSIEWSSGKINFIKSATAREDINDRTEALPLGGLKGHAIKRIEVFRKYKNPSNGIIEEELLKSVDLVQQYLYQNQGTESQLNPSYFTRLVLDGIISNDETYNFEYYYGDNKPNYPEYFYSRNTVQVDYWGYLKRNTDRRTLKPKIYCYPDDRDNAVYHSVYSVWPRSNFIGDEIIIEGNEMEPDLESIKLGLLKKVVLPTGGAIEVEYELNDFILDNQLRNGPGARVKTVRLTDPDAPQGNAIMSYSYQENNTSSGRISTIPDLAKQDLNAVAHNYSSFFNGDPPMFYATRCDRLFSTMIDLFGNNESTVYYSKVTVDYNGAGRKESFFENLFTAEDNSITVDGNIIVEKTNTVETSWYDCPDLPNVPAYLSSALHIDATPHFTFPITDWLNHSLKFEKVYDEDNNLVESTTFFYTVKKDLLTEIPYVQARLHNRVLEVWEIYDNGGLGLYPLGNDFVLSQYDMLWGVNKYISGHIELDKTIYKKFINGSIADPVVTTTEYEYYNNDHYVGFLSSKKVTNSDLKEFTDVYLYSFNYLDTYSSVIPKMLEDCYVIKLLENYSISDQKVYQGTFNRYIPHGDYVVLSDVLKLHLAEPTLNFIPSNQSTPYDQNYKNEESYTYYSNSGTYKSHLTESKKINNMPVAYLWGFPNYSSLLAIIENASYNEVVTELSAMGYTVDDLQSKTDNELISLFNLLRQRPNMKKTLITSFTSRPLIGATSVTNPSGQTSYYEYDSFGRLKYSRNTQLEYLNKFDYHYKNL